MNAGKAVRVVLFWFLWLVYWKSAYSIENLNNNTQKRIVAALCVSPKYNSDVNIRENAALVDAIRSSLKLMNRAQIQMRNCVGQIFNYCYEGIRLKS